MDELKPCPFCGATKPVEMNLDEASASGYWQVVCNYKEGGCGSSSGFRKTAEEAIRLWNRKEIKRWPIKHF